MAQYKWDYRTLNCWECFQARGKMCHDRDYESMIVATGSSYYGHGVCCKSSYDGPHCNNDSKHLCSAPSFITDKESKWADILSPDNLNYQMFAFCPSINQKICGLSDDPSKTDLSAYATLEKKKISVSNLKYIEGDSKTRVHHSCFYEIKPNITESEIT